MSWFEAVVLGIVQGLTEFLPISSTGHLRLVPLVAGWDDPGASFTAVTQLGTMLAVLVFFWRDLLRIVAAWLRGWGARRWTDRDARMGWFMIAGTIPIGVFGLLFDDQIRTVVRDLRLIAAALIVLGVLLWWVDRHVPQERTLDDVGWREALLVGLAQSAALIPGVSRSGATITMGRLLALTRGDAARFSFLLSVPAVVLSGLYEAQGIGQGASPDWGPTIAATAAAFIVGYASIAWLLRWLASHSMAVFAAYRAVVGLAVIAALVAGVVEPR